MGIPNLQTRLWPYTRRVSCYEGSENKKSELHGQSILIDGPNFAHWVYEKCYERRTRMGSASARTTPYSELETNAIQFLKGIESFGYRVKHIFFDGAIPQRKIETRLARRSARVVALVKKRRLTSRSCMNLFNVSEDGPVDPLMPPFLVSAIVEALFASEYRSRTHVVLKEAEFACAECSEAGDFILSDDSDLIVLNPEAEIIFFKDLALRPDDGLLDFNAISSRGLASRLGITDMKEFAFCLLNNPNLSLAACMQKLRSRNYTYDVEELQQFRALYNPSDPSLSYVIGDNAVGTLLGQTDPWISELINEIYEGGFHGHAARIWLANLNDDPDRASAWNSSRHLRHLIYSILVDTLAPGCDLLEVDRSGSRVAEHSVEIWPVHRVLKSAYDLVRFIQVHKSLHEYAAGPVSVWRALAFAWVVQREFHDSPILPRKDGILDLVAGAIKSFNWDHIHLGAKIEGTLYSLRIVHRVLAFLLAWSELRLFRLPTVLVDLFSELQSLPAIAALMPVPCACFEARECTDALKLQLAPFFIGNNNTENSPMSEDDSVDSLSSNPHCTGENAVFGSKRKVGKQKGTKGRLPLRLSNNAFDVLDERFGLSSTS